MWFLIREIFRDVEFWKDWISNRYGKFGTSDNRRTDRLRDPRKKLDCSILLNEFVHPDIDELIHEFDVDESDGIEIFEFISMIQKFQQDFQLDPTDELIEALQ